MSVLNFPRIYMNGQMFWNPPTANNNDAFPLYDAVKMQMNWPFLESFNITPDNAPTTLHPWLISQVEVGNVPDYVLKVPTNAGTLTPSFMPAEWDLFGDNGCGMVDFNGFKPKIIGGQTNYENYGNFESDSLVNKGFQLLGNPFGSDKPTPARFVDVSPWENTFTALYFDKLILGDSTCGLTLNRQYRMLDRFLNFNWAFDLGGLSYVTTTWQSCFPKENLEWVVGGSQLLASLKQQMESTNAKGLMYRFSCYLTFYDQNGIFNDYPVVKSHSSDPADIKRMHDMYQKGLDNVADIFFNPAYNCSAGTLGLWYDNEYPTAPGGRRLVPTVKVPLSKSESEAPSDAYSTSLGVISAEVHGDILSLDLLNTFPFYSVSKSDPDSPTIQYNVPNKFNAGSYNLKINSNGTRTQIAALDYAQYKQSEFDKRSGIVDFKLTLAQKDALQAGSLELWLSAGQDEETLVAKQQMWTAEVVESASFIDVGDTVTLNIMVQYDGLPAPAGTVLWVAEYSNPYMVTTSDYYLAFDNDADFTLFNNCPDDYSKNQAVLAQFSDSKVVKSPIASGSGRTVQELDKSSEETICEPVNYRTFLQTPTAINLSPCLQFSNPSDMEGTLGSPEEDRGTKIKYQVTKIQTDSNGLAKLTFNAKAPGFPSLRFFLQENNQQPSIPFSFNYTKAYVDFIAPIRVLPQEPDLEQSFIDCWNSVYQDQNARQEIWDNFIFSKILRPFYYLYPIMDKYMPLDDLSRVEGAIDQLIVLVSKEYQNESTLAMPITRDLPQSRRAVLEVWANKLVKRNYPPMPLSASDFE